MRNMGAKTIVAVDVGSEYSAETTNYGDDLSGWWLLWNKWNPFAETVKVSNQGPCSVESHIPSLPWVRSRVWVRVGLGSGLASGKGWVGTWPLTRLDP